MTSTDKTPQYYCFEWCNVQRFTDGSPVKIANHQSRSSDVNIRMRGSWINRENVFIYVKSDLKKNNWCYGRWKVYCLIWNMLVSCDLSKRVWRFLSFSVQADRTWSPLTEKAAQRRCKYGRIVANFQKGTSTWHGCFWLTATGTNQQLRPHWVHTKRERSRSTTPRRSLPVCFIRYINHFLNSHSFDGGARMICAVFPEYRNNERLKKNYEPENNWFLILYWVFYYLSCA